MQCSNIQQNGKHIWNCLLVKGLLVQTYQPLKIFNSKNSTNIVKTQPKEFNREFSKEYKYPENKWKCNQQHSNQGNINLNHNEISPLPCLNGQNIKHKKQEIRQRMQRKMNIFTLLVGTQMSRVNMENSVKILKTLQTD